MKLGVFFMAIIFTGIASAVPALTPPRPLNDDAESDTRADSVAAVQMTERGKVIAVWDSWDLSDPNNSYLKTACSSDFGRSWDAASTFIWHPDETDSYPSMATDGQGNWVVTWRSRRAGDSDIYTVYSHDDGLTWSTPEPLNSYAATDDAGDSRAEVRTDSHGLWLCAWESHYDLSDGSSKIDTDVLLSRSTDNGETWSEPTYLFSQDIKDDYLYSFVYGGGQTWLAVLDWSGTKGFYALRSDDNGQTWLETPLPIPTDPEYSQVDPSVAADGQGTWVYTWLRGVYIGYLGAQQLVTSCSEDDGLTWSEPTAVATIASYTPVLQAPSVTFSHGSTWLLAWSVDYGDENRPVTEGYVAESSDNGATWSERAAIHDYDENWEGDSAGQLQWVSAGAEHSALFFAARNADGGLIGDDVDLFYMVTPTDSDGDGVYDYEEPAGDADGDGLDNVDDSDSNNNGTPDGIERALGLDPWHYDPGSPVSIPVANRYALWALAVLVTLLATVMTGKRIVGKTRL